MFSSESIFSSSLGKYGKILLDKPSSCSRIPGIQGQLWPWFKRLWFWLLLHWYEHPNHKLHAYSLQYLGISEYLIPLSQIVLTCSNPSHSPEDAVILIVLRRMSLSNLYFPGLNLTFLDLIATFAIHHPPTSWQTYTKVTEKALFSFWKTLPDISKTLPDTVTDRPMDPVCVSLLPQSRVLGPVACPIASYCKLKQAQHQWNGRQFWRVLCSPSSNGSMLGPIKFFIVRSSFCLGFPTARLCSTAGCNQSPTLLSCSSARNWLRLLYSASKLISLASLKINETSIKQYHIIPPEIGSTTEHWRPCKCLGHVLPRLQFDNCCT